jgi:3-oxoacyl-[acyl-carrier protein] reductase
MIAGRHSGRNVLVSGAASGIGAAIAQRYCEEGARVALLDLNPQAVQAQGEALRAQGFHVAWQAADVGDFEQCQHACALLAKEIGRVDTLINNAGISPKHEGKPAPIWQMSPTEWQQVVAVNLNGAFNLSRLLSPSMIEQRFGRIINMSSVAGSAYLPLVAAHYSATKAAIIGFTRHLAGELGAYGITANALAPGRIAPPLLKTVASAANEAVIADTPLLRLGQPCEVADAACYLSAPDSAFITGQVLDVAGGWLMR